MAFIVKRARARHLIERVRVLTAAAGAGEMKHADALHCIARELLAAGVPELTPCHGEAHKNPHIDNCTSCAPRWGWIGQEVKIT